MNTSEFQLNLAVVIGINDYQNGIPTLETARQDAEAIADILKSDYQYQVHLITESQATAQNLQQWLETDLPEALKTANPSRLLFYFAGHGIALNGDEGPQGYLIPQDAKLGDSTTYLPMQQVEAALTNLSCRHCLIILDCCFAGAFRWSSTRKLLSINETIHQERYDRFIQDPAWQVITSAASDQYANDSLDIKGDRGVAKNDTNHSPFAAALIEALSGKADAYPPSSNGKPAGDGVITATELYIYLRDAVEPATEGSRQRQTPGIWPLKKHDKGEYIFLTPGHPLNLPPAPPLDDSKNPYRGLESFEEEHSELFFGRTELVEKLQDFVKTHPLTVVLGASGSGKSSLVKAGLIPQLRQETTEEWCILPPIRPGETPFPALNNAFKDAQLPEVAVQNPQQNLAMSIDVWAKNHPNSKLFLFIDQSEEIITLCQKEDERRSFFRQILNAINVHRDKLRVVLSLRSDFEPQVRDAGFTGDNKGNTELQSRWQSGRFIVPAMTRADLREAIEKPAETRVMYFDPHELVEQLIDEVADMPGALPLLSFALSELYLKYLQRQWEAQKVGETIDRSLTQADYQDLGGVIRSLTQRADREYEELVKENPAYAQIIPQVMLRMVAIGGGELARRRVPLSELEYPLEKNDLVKKVIERFTTARLLVKGEDADRKPYVEPAHDALVRGWQKLLEWKQEDEESLFLQRRLTPAAVEWSSKRQNGFLWNADPRLDLLKQVLKSEDNWFNEVEVDFVRRSVKKKRQNSTIRGIVAGSVIVGSVFAVWMWRDSQLNLAESLGRDALFLVTNEQRNLDGFVQAIKAGKILRDQHTTNPEVIDALQKALDERSEQNRFTGHQDAVTSVAVTPDGKTLVSGSKDKTIKVWNLEQRRKPLTLLKGHQDAVTSVAITRDGKTLVSGGREIEVWNLEEGGKWQSKTLEVYQDNDKSINSVAITPDGKTLVSGGRGIKVWNLEEGGKWQSKTLEVYQDNDKSINSVAITPDGKTLVAGGRNLKVWNLEEGGKWQSKTLEVYQDNDKGVNSVAITPGGKTLVAGTKGTKNSIIKVWNLEKEEEPRIFAGHKNSVNSVAITSNGKTLVSGSEDQTIKLWNIDTGKEIRTLKGRPAIVNSVAITPDGKILASGSEDQTIKLWNVDTDKEIRTLRDHEESVTSISINSNNKILASGSLDKTIKLWNVKTGDPIRTLPGDDPYINSVSFNPKGKVLASSDGKTIKLWNVDTGKKIRTLPGHDHNVNSVSFSPNGKILASGSDDRTIKLWNVDTGDLIRPIPGHNDSVLSVSFSPNGKILASGSYDRTIKLWNVDTGDLIRTLTGHNDNVVSVSFSSNGKILASGSYDRTIKLWNVDTGDLIRTLTGHNSWVWSVSFSGDSKTLASGSHNNTIKLWNVDTGKEIHSFMGHNKAVLSVIFSSDAQTLASGSQDKKIKLWNLNAGWDLDALMERSCDWVQGYLENPSSDVIDSDRHLCDDVPKVVAKDKSF